MEYVSHRGGGYTEFPPSMGHGNTIEAFSISHDCEMRSEGFRSAGASQVNVSYPPAKIPSKNDSVWDWAFFFCMVECHSGNNSSERDMLDALANSDFIEICESVIISDWEGLHYEDIYLFDNRSHAWLARNAQYMAATMGVIKVPHVPDVGVMREKEIIDNERIDHSALSIDHAEGDVF